MRGVIAAFGIGLLLSWGCTVDVPVPPSSEAGEPDGPGSVDDGSGDGSGDGIAGAGSEDAGELIGSSGDGSGASGGVDGAGDGSGATGGFAAPTDDPCLTLTPTIRGTDGPDRLVGTDGRDVIFGYSGDDEIWGNGGNDVICAGGGEDRVEGGAGNDYIDMGFGRDTANGGAGHDILHGRSGGDVLRGGHGNDVLHGDLLDDHMYGDEGNDVLIGGHGIDVMHGGEGDDWLRGDTNRDEFTGGAGTDTASFLTTTPPGQPLGSLPRVDGVIVNNQNISAGRASGDGYQETLVGVERIVGSAFGDHIVGGAGTTYVAGSYGDDAIDAPSASIEPAPSSGELAEGALVFVTADPADVGLLAIGTDGDDHFVISVSGGVATVRSGNGAALTAGTGCTHAGAASIVACVLIAELRFIVGWGGAGVDRIELEGSGFPRDLTTTLDGGDDSDVLAGHSGQDILFAGHTGNDSLEGFEGDDALLSESSDADSMLAGGGNDQLVTNHPCAGHSFVGGGGIDVGGFARVGTHFDTAAERHRQRIHAQIGYRAYQPAFCERNQGTQLGFDIEILEGAGGNDELIGSDGNDTIWGWGGDDLIRGLGGNDTIEGHRGDDTIYGGAGQDRLRGGSDYDTLHASDGERDFQLDCGGGGGTIASRDSVDPPGC